MAATTSCGRQVERGMVGRRPDRFKVLGFTTEMADLMRISTLFVGKPGGLSSSECMAAGLPMVIINPIPGQEVRNRGFSARGGRGDPLQLHQHRRLQARHPLGRPGPDRDVWRQKCPADRTSERRP